MAAVNRKGRGAVKLRTRTARRSRSEHRDPSRSHDAQNPLPNRVRVAYAVCSADGMPASTSADLHDARVRKDVTVGIGLLHLLRSTHQREPVSARLDRLQGAPAPRPIKLITARQPSTKSRLRSVDFAAARRGRAWPWSRFSFWIAGRRDRRGSLADNVTSTGRSISDS
jgi:hypothetical protein